MYNIDEENSDIDFQVTGDKVAMKVRNSSGQGGGSDIYLIKESDATSPSDSNTFSALRALKEIKDNTHTHKNKTELDKIDQSLSTASAVKFAKVTATDAELGTIKAINSIKTGSFTSGLLGSGSMVDKIGNGEWESGTFRTFMSAKSFVYNLVEVNVGERWSTNGFCKIKNVDTADQIITEQLDDDELSTMAQGDICRGIFSDLDNTYNTADKDSDDCGFPTRAGFFTTYFSVVSILSSKKGSCTFRYALRNDSTPSPCALMQAAQYGSFTDANRRASIFQSNYPHAYTENLEGVNTWVISSPNITKRDGYLGELTITNKNGSTTKLEGNGLYVQDNVYFGNAVIQLDPKTLADLQKDLTNYIISLSAYADNFTADPSGNIVGGLWFEDDKGSKQYRIHTAISVRNNNKILTIADDGKDAEEGTYKLYVQAQGCTAEVHNSTVFVTGIESFNDGIATSDDGTTHTDEWYDKMRKTNACSLIVIVDCEGKGSVTKQMNIGIKHTEDVFALADMDNEMSNIIYSIKNAAYSGFTTASSGLTVKHNGEAMKIKSIVIGSIDGITSTSTVASDKLSASISFASSLTTDTLADSFVIPITVVATYAGVDYENTLYKKFVKIKGTASYELSPSVGAISATYSNNTKVLSPTSISCGIKCYDDAGENYNLTSTQQTSRGLRLTYTTYDQNGNVIASAEISLDTSISLTSSVYKILFSLSKNSAMMDKETIFVNSDGKSSFTYIRYATDINGSGMQDSFDSTHIYIGIYTGALSVAPTTASSYTWMKWKGDTGEGVDGLNGYVHIAWCNTSDNSDNSFTISNPNGAAYAYIGTYTDNSAADSTTFSTYTWVKVKGAKGDNAYLHIKFAPTNDTTKSDMSDTPSMSIKYIGIRSDNTESASTTKSDYIWSLFYGQDGESYQIIYRLTATETAPSAYTGTEQPTSTTKGQWTDNPLSCDETNYPYQYSSMRTKSNGIWSSWSSPAFYNRYAKDGLNAYLHIRFAKTSDTSISDMSDTPTSEYKYIGLYTDNTLAASSDKSKYVWSPFYGQDGKGYELVYKLTTNDTKPSKNASNKDDVTNTSGGWYDDIQSVSSSYAYMWVSRRTQTAGVWSNWSTPSLYSRFASDGADGFNGEYKQTLYRLDIQAPTKPTYASADLLPASSVTQPAWQTSVPVEDDTDIIYTDVVGKFILSGDNIKSPVTAHAAYSCLKITITTYKDNALVVMPITASSENNYDIGYVSNLDDAVSTTPRSMTSYKAKISGTDSQTLYFPIATAGTHTIYVYYAKDGSGVSGDDCIYFRCVVPRIYYSTARATMSTAQTVYQYGTWTDALQLNQSPVYAAQAILEHNTYHPTSYDGTTGAATADISDVQTISLMAGQHLCVITSVTVDNTTNMAVALDTLNNAKMTYSAVSGTVLQSRSYNVTVTGKYNGITYTAKTFLLVDVPLKGAQGNDGVETIYCGWYESTRTYVYNESIRNAFRYQASGWSTSYKYRLKNKGASLKGVPPTNMTGDDNYEVATSIPFVAEELAITDEQITDKLTVRKMKTAATGARIEAEGTLMKVFGTSNVANIIFGVNSDGLAVLTYYDNSGNKLYDLGPSGIAYVQVREAKMTQMYMRLVGTTADAVFSAFSLSYNGDALPKATKKLNTDTVYKFTAKMVAGTVDANQSAYDGKCYSSSSTNSATGAPSGSTIPDGWYEDCDTDSLDYGNIENVDYDNSTLNATTLDNYDSRNETVIAQPYVHSKILFHYVSGKYNHESIVVYWNSTYVNR